MIDLEKFFAEHLGKFPEHEDITIPGIGPVKVKVLTQGEKDKWDMAIEKDRVGFRARLLQATVIDDRGILVFSEEDVPKIMQMPLYILEPAVEAAMRINRLSSKDREELEKNSTGQPVSS